MAAGRSLLCGVVAATLAAFLGGVGFAQDAAPLYKDPKAALEDRVSDLLARMTLEEKVDQLGGTGMDTPDNERLGIPGFKMSDGPHGARAGQATCFPTLLAIGATWDPDLMQRVGAALGREFRGKGKYVALGPCINVIRDPRGGRSFETFGEDPYLIGQLAVAYIKGMQSEKVIATPKHFACNNQENGRTSSDSQVGERTLREFYLPHFKAAIQEGGAWSIMSAYNRVNSPYCTASVHLQRDILKGDWGFKGFVMSDWGACHATFGALTGGLDVEMPTGVHFGKPLLEAAQKGEVPLALIDDAVRRVLRAKFWAGVFEKPVTPNESMVNTAAHKALALEAAQKAIVLLKNTGNLLPLDTTKVKSVAVIGPNAAVARPTGGGSSQVDPYYAVSLLDGIKDRAGTGVQITLAQGLTMDGDYGLSPIKPEALRPLGDDSGKHGLLGEYFNNVDLKGQPALTRIDEDVNFNWAQGSPGPRIGQDKFSARWQGTITVDKSGEYWLATTTDDGVRLYIDGQRVIDVWSDHGSQTDRAKVTLEAGRAHDIRLEYFENGGDAVARLSWSEPPEEGRALVEARAAAAAADVAIVAVGTSPRIESEGVDRDSLALPPGQDELVSAIVEANKNTVVVAVNGSAVFMDPWLDQVPAIVQCWFDGQESGNAIADVLFGKVNPSGKLPVTFPRSEQQMPSFTNVYETIGEGRGYRWYDKQKLEPMFAFGHGLSYTTFEYDNLRLTPDTIPSRDRAQVTVDVRNRGLYAGEEVVQLYVSYLDSKVERPAQELKAFTRVKLTPGQRKTVRLDLGAQQLAYYDVNTAKWTVEPGKYEVRVGSSSRDIRARTMLTVR